MNFTTEQREKFDSWYNRVRSRIDHYKSTRPNHIFSDNGGMLFIKKRLEFFDMMSRDNLMALIEADSVIFDGIEKGAPSPLWTSFENSEAFKTATDTLLKNNCRFTSEQMIFLNKESMKYRLGFWKYAMTPQSFH